MTRILLTHAALANIAETGFDPQTDVLRLMAGSMTEDELLAECLDGADMDRVQGWHDYVDAVALASEARSITLTPERSAECGHVDNSGTPESIAEWYYVKACVQAAADRHGHAIEIYASAPDCQPWTVHVAEVSETEQCA